MPALHDQLDTIAAACRSIMDRADAEGRDLTAAELDEIRSRHREFNAARASGVRSRADFEGFLRESGFPRSAARKLAGGGWAALRPGDMEENSDDLLAAIKAATAAMRG